MAIQISGTEVIDNSRNFINLPSVKTGIAGTQSWNSGKSSVNLGVYPGPDSGDISVDGKLIVSSLDKLIYPLA